jgi:hypothetical protein
MSLVTTTAMAFAILIAADASTPALEDAPGASQGEGYIQLAKHGYFRRDLGLDPLYHDQQYPDADHHTHQPRGFRSDNAATEPPSGAGILIYDTGPNSDEMFILPRGGFRFDHNDPGQLDR